MSDTHPNAFWAQAQEKRAEANRLNGEADTLEAQAKELEGASEAPVEAAKPEANPAVGEPQTDAPKGKLFSKK